MMTHHVFANARPRSQNEIARIIGGEHEWTVTIRCDECGAKQVFKHRSPTYFKECWINQMDFMQRAVKKAKTGYHRTYLREYGLSYWLHSLFRKR